MKWIVVAIVLAFASAAAADEATDQARREFDAGTAEYKLGRFETALAAYERAYQAKPLPGFLFNIGQCHFNLANWERASFFYQQYLHERPEAPNRELVEAQLAEANAKLEAAERERQEADAAERERQTARERAAKDDAERARLEGMRRAAEADERAADARRLAAEAEAGGVEPWMIWAGVGTAAAVVLVGGTALVVALTAPSPEKVPPSGSLGTIDAR